MSRNVRTMACPPAAVFRVLENGWLYAGWVTGASRIREVDAAWPAPGSKIHHSVGVWPALLNDESESLEWEPGRRLVLRARGWPAGEAHVRIEVEEHPDGCRVQIDEFAAKGPARFLPKAIADTALYVRNIETLHRLALLAEGGAP